MQQEVGRLRGCQIEFMLFLIILIGKHVEHQDDNNLATETKEAKKIPSYQDDIDLACIECEIGQPWYNIYSHSQLILQQLGTFLNTIKRILDVLHCRTPL
ncbi:hypothetical protein Tco_1469595, partial [Tanacetum coccineum]